MSRVDIRSRLTRLDRRVLGGPLVGKQSFRINERLLLVFVTLMFGGFAFAIGMDGDNATGITSAFAGTAGLVILVAVEVRLARQGRFILRDPRAREANRVRITNMRRRSVGPAVAVGMSIAALADGHGTIHLIGVAVAEAVAGFCVGLLATAVWVSFRFRPDEHVGEWL